MIQVIGCIPHESNKERGLEVLEMQMKSMKEHSGCVSVKLSKGPVMSPNGPSKYQLVITATWNSLDEFVAWASSDVEKKKMPILRELKVEIFFYELSS